MVRVLIASVSILLSQVEKGQAMTDSGVFNPQVWTLGNGMNVVLLENHQLPIVAHMMWYKVGAANDPLGRSGIAHFFEHLMFKGTKNLKPGEFSKIVGKLGGEDNAFTSWDYTAYFQKIGIEHLPTVMEMEADRMENLALDETSVSTERDVVAEERRQVIDNQPMRILSEQIQAALYQNHPYQRPIIGWAHEIDTLSRQDALDFYEKWYAPNNATVVVAGDITRGELEVLVSKHYGGIKPNSNVPQHTEIKEPPHITNQNLKLESKEAELPVWTRTTLAPSYSTTDDWTQIEALTVIEEAVGNSETGMLQQKLVRDLKLATMASLSYDGYARGVTALRITVIPKDTKDATLKAIETAVQDVFADVRTNGIEDTMLKRVKTSLVAEAAFSQDSLIYPAMSIGKALTYSLSVDVVEKWPQRVETVTNDDIKAVLNSLNLEYGVTATLLPK